MESHRGSVIVHQKQVSLFPSVAWSLEILQHITKQRTNPKLLIFVISNLTSGVTTHFSGSESVTFHSLTISSMKAEDATAYYCQ
ncbi:hypothetical protein A6R68_09873 [Neotoma lepida]|uniref:Ig-like domain-containing protein n=1 Tax=Neotoma lepida TaxID=56216 RepID=A0A1A6G0S5_NEOLE|nr:hypothetical protein A6R68_09873 [Neotoma lepida]